ncbi:MAG TPA: SAM-dependent methyltransferase [Streptosporangiaceae bacterium]|jgi:SAM-dependent methyltransferase|nr:SAM-dependent methyltransferase [Streptosporangiaceae bacterium]
MAAESGTPSASAAETPNTARMYDYYLGGKDNYAADREAAEQVLANAPEIRRVAMENRAFLGRVVGFLAGEAGIQQFIDIGTGLPTRGNVPEIALEAAPGARVVCVDHDPVVCAHARALLPGAGNVEVVEAAMEDPGAILSNPAVTGQIDFSRPAAVLFFSVLHFADDASRIVRAFREAMAPGSYLALSHGVAEQVPGGSGPASQVRQIYGRSDSPRGAFRTREEVLALFDGFELVTPGLVPVADWRPSRATSAAGRTWLLGGLGRKPDRP